jgi:hypothetical protein
MERQAHGHTYTQSPDTHTHTHTHSTDTHTHRHRHTQYRHTHTDTETDTQTETVQTHSYTHPCAHPPPPTPTRPHPPAHTHTRTHTHMHPQHPHTHMHPPTPTHSKSSALRWRRLSDGAEAKAKANTRFYVANTKIEMDCLLHWAGGGHACWPLAASASFQSSQEMLDAGLRARGARISGRQTALMGLQHGRESRCSTLSGRECRALLAGHRFRRPGHRVAGGPDAIGKRTPARRGWVRLRHPRCGIRTHGWRKTAARSGTKRGGRKRRRGGNLRCTTLWSARVLGRLGVWSVGMVRPGLRLGRGLEEGHCGQSRRRLAGRVGLGSGWLMRGKWRLLDAAS